MKLLAFIFEQSSYPVWLLAFIYIGWFGCSPLPTWTGFVRFFYLHKLVCLYRFYLHGLVWLFAFIYIMYFDWFGYLPLSTFTGSDVCLYLH